MQIVGVDDPQRDPAHVHTIDIWFSSRRNVWIVERLNEAGDLVGSAFAAQSEEDARDCLAEWLRGHTETYLASPGQTAAHRGRVTHPRRRAA